MAIVKTIPIHNDTGIKKAVEYITDENKTALFYDDSGNKTRVVFDNKGNIIEGEISSNVRNALTYAENAEKTMFKTDDDEDLLVSGFNCDRNSASFEFMGLRQQYENRLRAQNIDPASRIHGKKRGRGKYKDEMVDKEAREAYHIIMSFPQDINISPRLVHLIGLEFCERAFPDTKAVVSTHMNTKHLHNHIVRSAYNMSTATKYRDTISELQRLRNISDELSLKYGLEIIVNSERDNRQGHSYIENLERKRGNSWKEIMKEDIKKCIEMSNSWDEFKVNLTAAGYGINEKPNTVTYSFLNDSNKRIRDKRLGDDFTRDFIKDLYGKAGSIYPKADDKAYSTLKADGKSKEDAIEKSGSKIEAYKEHKRQKNKHFKLYVSRYSLSGRRRSDTELLFLAAIKLIKHFKNDNYDRDLALKFKGNPVYHTYPIKLSNMENSLALSMMIGVRDEEHLKELKKECAIKKKILESDIKAIEQNLKAATILDDKVKELSRIKKQVESGHLGNIDINPLEYTKEEIRNNYAKLEPMTPGQRRDLYVKLQDSGYRVTCKYDCISYTACQEILGFLAGKTDKEPDVLISDEEYKAHSRNNYYDKMRIKRDEAGQGKLSGKGVSEGQKRIIAKIKAKHPEITAIPDNMYDAARFISYFMAENPLKDKVLGTNATEALKKTIAKKGHVLSRDIITAKEAGEVYDYIYGRLKKMPDVLKPAEHIKDYQINQITELLKLKNVSISVPVDKLTVTDYYAMIDFLLHKDVIPDVLKNDIKDAGYNDIAASNSQRNEAFDTDIKDLPVENQRIMYQYRAIVNELASLGYGPGDYGKIPDNVKKLAVLYIKTGNEIKELNYEYRNLARLDYNLNLAKNKAYTHGPKAEPEKAEALDVNVHDNKPEIKVSEEVKSCIAEDEKIERDAKSHSSGNYRSGSSFALEDDYFDID